MFVPRLYVPTLYRTSKSFFHSGVFRRYLEERKSLPDFKPHSFRHTLAQLGSHLCTTPAEYKAWSQNLGRAGVLVTLTRYGTLPNYTQAS